MPPEDDTLDAPPPELWKFLPVAVGALLGIVFATIAPKEGLKALFGDGVDRIPRLASGLFGFVTGSACGLVSWLLGGLVRGVRHNAKLLRSVLYVRPYRIAGIEEYLGELAAIDDEAKRGLALSFAVGSLRRVSTTGFIQADVNVRSYVRFLTDCCKQCSRRLYATCTVRPLWFYQAVSRSDHLEPFRMGRQPGFGGRVRVAVLSDQDVASIIQDTVVNLVRGPENGTAEAYDLPEAQFFMDVVADTAEKFIVYWALQSELGNLLREAEDWFDGLRDARSLISDYVVFDAELVLKFAFDGQRRGSMSLLWGQHVAAYSRPFCELRQLDANPPRVGRGVPITPPNLESQGYFRTLNQLLSSRSALLVRNSHLDFSLQDADATICQTLGVDRAWKGTDGVRQVLDDDGHTKIVAGLANRQLAIRSGFTTSHPLGQPQAATLAEPQDWEEFLRNKNLRVP